MYNNWRTNLAQRVLLTRCFTSQKRSRQLKNVPEKDKLVCSITIFFPAHQNHCTNLSIKSQKYTQASIFISCLIRQILCQGGLEIVAVGAVDQMLRGTFHQTPITQILSLDSSPISGNPPCAWSGRASLTEERSRKGTESGLAWS